MTEENNQPNTSGETAQENETFESWLETQDEKVKGFIDTHTSGLKNTVKAVRGERDALAKQIRDLTAQAEAGSETQKKLEELSKELETAQKRNNFVESAMLEGCTNTKAAYALAVSENLFKRDGSPDWVEIKKEAPQLFEQKKQGSAFAGNGKGIQPANDVAFMNQLIRS